MMNEASIEYIISRVIENANEALAESKQNPNDDFVKGRKLAYYEVLDTIKSELIARDYDLKKVGLDVELEETFL